MRQFVQVFFWNDPMGILAFDSLAQSGQFEFFPEFLSKGYNFSPILFPIETWKVNPKICLLEKASELPAFLRDVLPGSYASDLLREALHDATKTPESLSALSFLSLMGNRSMGAFRFESAGYPELDAVEPVDFDQLVKFAHSIYVNKGPRLSERRIRTLLRSGLFTKGSWPKALVAINDFTGEVVSGQAQIPEGFEAWIIKLDGVGSDDTSALMEEYSYYKKALECGIQMAPCRMLKDGHTLHLLCKRFDRVGNERLHVQSFLNLGGGHDYSYEAVFRCLRQLHFPYPVFVEFFKRMVFNVLIGNKNDGPEKINFIYNRSGMWSLAPAYNLKPTPVLDEHALSVGGKVRDITKEDLLELGRMLNIKQAKLILKNCSEVLEK